MPNITDSIRAPQPGGAYEPPGPLSLEFRHRTIGGVSEQADNIDFPWYWTRLDHPALNDMPQAILTVTPVGRIEINEQAQTANLVQNPHPIGVVFRSQTMGDGKPWGRWYIYNLGLEAMELNVDFHVAIHEAKRSA
jgi:hypothetical protein